MQTLHRLRRFRDLRAVSSGAWPPADGVPVRCGASEWKGALPLPNLLQPTFAVGSRPAVPVTLFGTGPESGAVPRGRQRQRAIRFRLPRVRDRLPDRVCRAAIHRQFVSMSACMAGCISDRPHGQLPGCLPVCRFALLPVWRSACLCPSPDR